MKSVAHKLLTIFLMGLIYTPCFSQTIIQMEEYGGVYRIPCKVNGAKMKLIFDTGADKVCLSLSMAEYLFDNDFISSKDIIGSGSSTVADGRIVDHVEINIKDIEIGGIHLYNVRSVVIEEQNSPLLLGQSAIQKLGPIEINGNILIIKNGEESNDAFIDRLFNEANQAYDNKLYGRATEKYAQLYTMNLLSEYGIYLYAKSCWLNNDAQKAADLLSKINDYSWFEENKVDIYRFLGYINEEFEKYQEAANYYLMSNSKIQTEDADIFDNLISAADCYRYLQYYETAMERYMDAEILFAKMYNVNYDYIHRDCENKLKKNEKSYRNDSIDYVIFQVYYCMEKTGRTDSISFLRKVAKLARAKNKYAMKYCNDLTLNPYDDLWY